MSMKDSLIFLATAVLAFVVIFLIGFSSDKSTVEVRKGTIVNIDDTAEEDSDEASSWANSSSSGAYGKSANGKAREVAKEEDVESIADENNRRIKPWRLPAHMITYWRENDGLFFSYDKYREFTRELVGLNTSYSAGPYTEAHETPTPKPRKVKKVLS